MDEKQIAYPYMPHGRAFVYVPTENPFMIEAKNHAKGHSLDKVMPNASVLVKDGKIIKMAANGSDYHEKNICQRIVLGSPTGQGYELCEGCHPKNHSEGKLMRLAAAEGIDANGADIYLWGHWWCCEPCWSEMLRADIRNVYLLKNSEILFNKNHPANIVGRQFS